MTTQSIALDALVAHPRNSNVMSDELMTKLAAHIGRTGRYPPLIVRPLPDGRYQLLDGHHRAAVLRSLGHSHANCVVWHVDDAEALLLLATLNRLEGADDPRKRASLVDELRGLPRLDDLPLPRLLPEDDAALARLMQLSIPPLPRPAAIADHLPVAIHFFVSPAQKRAIEAALTATNLPRDRALLHLLHLEGVQP